MARLGLGFPAIPSFVSNAYMDAGISQSQLDGWHVIPNFDRVAIRGLSKFDVTWPIAGFTFVYHHSLATVIMID